PVRLLRALVMDDDPAVRASACERAWPHLAAAERRALVDDSELKVRTQALLLHHRDHPMSRAVFEGGEVRRYDAVEKCRLDPGLVEWLLDHTDQEQRRRLARNPFLDAHVLVERLGRDPGQRIREEAFLNPVLTDAQRSEIHCELDPKIHYRAIEWIVELHDDPDAMRRLAASPHFLIRRSVARAKRLPFDVVERLARDEDEVVQLFLAESCDDAPADMLLRVWAWWTGSLSVPDRPFGHPNFPRIGLLEYADHPNPRFRRLALDDPESTADLVERFSRDDDAEVRSRAAADPRLSAASVMRLLQDPDPLFVRQAVRHPSLPARVLVRLLRDPATAEAAASNPSLPHEIMRGMVRRFPITP
ncbi:hypothetical protein ACFQ07_27120, partial [Actinomadura adrarensis]